MGTIKSLKDLHLLPYSFSFEKGRQVLFFILFFSFIILLGKHFWPGFSFVNGIRVDYLSPTFYFSDLVIALLFLFEVFDKVKKREFNFFIICGLILALLFVYIPFIHSSWAHLYGVITLLKFIFVGHVVARHFRRDEINILLLALSFGVLIESLLVFGQFFLQGSIEGPFYFLGERAISPASIGAATFWIFGKEVLRPYGSFPHPNVLAFFLFFSNVLFISFLQKKINFIFLTSLILGSVALFLTFSRLIIFLYVVFLIYTFLKHKRWYLTFCFVALVFIYVVLFLARFSVQSFLGDLNLRLQLINTSFKVMSDSIFFGSGFGNYFYEEVLYQKTISPIFLQPVHNIYLLVWLQAGIFGLIGFLGFVVKALFHLHRKIKINNHCFDKALLALMLAVIFVGFFDHFLLTLQQGQLMLAVLLGLVWSK